MSNVVSAAPDDVAGFPEGGRAVPARAGGAEWSFWQRVVFRFGFVYLLLFCAPMAPGIASLPWIAQTYAQAWDRVLPLVGRHVLGISGAIPTVASGSGDRTVDYIGILCYAVLALAATVVWSVVGRRQREHERLYRGLRVLVRFTLGFIMLSYGVVKLFGGQFPPPGEGRLLQRFGDSSPMGLLWTFMGASKAYVVFSGAAETLGAVLVLFRRTTTLGALVLAAVLTNVVMMNFCYDVAVKINSAHYLAMSLFLLLPDLGRLGNVLLFNRPTEPAPPPPPFRRRWMRVSLPIVKLGLIVVLVTSCVVEARTSTAIYSRTPRNWYDGTWNVASFVRDDQDVPAVVTDASRWQRLRFESDDQRSYVRWRNMDDSYGDLFRVTVDAAKQTMTLTPAQGSAAGSTHTLTYTRPDADGLTLEGKVAEHHLLLKLEKLQARKMLLNTRGFHWINEVPFNR